MSNQVRRGVCLDYLKGRFVLYYVVYGEGGCNKTWMLFVPMNYPSTHPLKFTYEWKLISLEVVDYLNKMEAVTCKQ